MASDDERNGPRHYFEQRARPTNADDREHMPGRLRKSGTAVPTTPLATWMAHLRKINTDAAWRYLAFLGEAIIDL